MGSGGTSTTPWRALTGAVLLDLAVSPLFAWDVFTDSLRRDLGAGDALLAGVFSVGLLCFMVGVLLGGRLADTTAPRRLALVALLGSVAGLVGTAVAASPGTLFVTFGVLVGGSTGLGYATAVRVAGTVAARRGLALGLVVSAYAAGTAVLAPLSARLLDAVGRGPTFLLLAAGLGALLVVAAVLVPGTAPRSPQVHDDGGVPVPRGPVVVLWLLFGLGSAPGLAAFAQAGALAGTPGATALAVALLNVGNVVGRLVAGPVSDRLGRPAALHLDLALLVLACLTFAAGATGTPALGGLLLLGAQYGALSVLTPAATADVVPARRFGAAYGRVFTSWGVAGLTAPVAATALAAATDLATVYAAFLGVAALAWAAVIAYGRSGRVRPSAPS